MNSTYSKTGSRPGKPGYRTPSFFIRGFLNKVRNYKIFIKNKKFFNSNYFFKNKK